MSKYQEAVDAWESSLCEKLELGGLYARNPVAHKWKVGFRCMTLRELVAWRFVDLLKQGLFLVESKHILGARILFRSSLETLAFLIHINQKMANVVKTGSGFHEFSDTTSRLLLGSRDESTRLSAINIISVLEKCERKYKGIMKLYNSLSESAHPNWQGVSLGYCETDYDNFVSYFGNHWEARFGREQDTIVALLMLIFELEYNDVFPEAFDAFEEWIEKNDESLEAPKQGI